MLPARQVTRGAGRQESRVHRSVSNFDEAVMHAPMLEEECRTPERADLLTLDVNLEEVDVLVRVPLFYEVVQPRAVDQLRGILVMRAQGGACDDFTRAVGLLIGRGMTSACKRLLVLSVSVLLKAP